MVIDICKTAGLPCPQGGQKLALMLKPNKESLKAVYMAVHTWLWNANRWTLDYPKNLTFYGNKKTEAYLCHLFVCHGLPEVQNVLCLAWGDYIV